jgi:sugar phosphate isomerase/epimerase
MKISISTSFLYELPIEEQIPLVSKAGFTHVSIGCNPNHSGHLNKFKRNKLKKILVDNNLKVDTIHGERLDTDNIVEKTENIIESALALSVKTIVVHGGPFNFNAGELNNRLNKLMDNCQKISNMFQETNVSFALENVMPGPATEIVINALTKLDKKMFGFCYDSSHDQIGGPKEFTIIDILEQKLLSVHLSDRIADFVDHVIPGEGFINWDTLCKKLKEVKYNKPILMETMVANSKYKKIDDFLKKTYESGCLIWKKINN